MLTSRARLSVGVFSLGVHRLTCRRKRGVREVILSVRVGGGPWFQQGGDKTPPTVHNLISSLLCYWQTQGKKACDYTPGTRCQTDWGAAGRAGRPLCYQTRCCPESGERRTGPSDDVCSSQTHAVLHVFLPLWEGWMDMERRRETTEGKRRHEGVILVDKEQEENQHIH